MDKDQDTKLTVNDLVFLVGELYIQLKLKNIEIEELRRQIVELKKEVTKKEE